MSRPCITHTFCGAHVKQVHEKRLFKPGSKGAGEAQLYAVSGHDDGSGTAVQYVAAQSIEDAVLHIRKWHPALSIQKIELLGIVEMLSGAPLD